MMINPAQETAIAVLSYIFWIVMFIYVLLIANGLIQSFNVPAITAHELANILEGCGNDTGF